MSFHAATVVRTRAGYAVEVMAVLSPGNELENGDSVIGIIVYPGGARGLCSWRRDGAFDPSSGPKSLDLCLPEIAAKAREVAHV